MPNPELNVRIGAVITDLERELAKAKKGIKGLADTTEKQSKRIKKSSTGISKSIKTLIGVIGAVELLRFGVRLVKDLTKLAVQMEGESRRAAIVFGESLAFVTKEAEKTAIALGLTRREYVAAAAATQDLLIPLGFQRKEASRLSVELTNLSGVLSNWVGGQKTAREVSEILTKTILGETEQIKTLGIKIDQTSKSFNQRIKQLQETKNLTLEQAKALEILNQITTKSADAQTEFASATKSLSLQEAEANALFREQKEILADDIIPLYIEWLSLKRGFIKGFGDFSLVLKSELSFFEKFNALTGLGILVGEKSAAVIADRIRENRKLEKTLKEAVRVTQKYNKEHEISITNEKLRERWSKKTNEQLEKQIEIIGKLSEITVVVNETIKGTGKSFIDQINKLKKLQLETATTTAQWEAFEKQIQKVKNALDLLTGRTAPTKQIAIGTVRAGATAIPIKEEEPEIIPFSERFSEAEKQFKKLLLIFQEFDRQANQLITSSIADTFGKLGDAIGEALAEGGNVLKAVGQTILASLGQFLSAMGGLLIKYGTLAVLKGKLDLAILAGGPVSIAAGLAAIAVGVALKAAGAALGKAATGGTGGARSYAGGTGGSGAPSDRRIRGLAGNANLSSGKGTVVFKIAGTELRGVLSNSDSRQLALGGNNANLVIP